MEIYPNLAAKFSTGPRHGDTEHAENGAMDSRRC